MFTVHVAHRTRAPLVWTSVWTRCPRTPPRAFTPYGDSVLGRAYMVHVDLLDVRYRTRKRNPTGAAERGPSGRATPTPTEKHGRKTPRADGRRDTEVYIITRDPPRCESGRGSNENRCPPRTFNIKRFHALSFHELTSSFVTVASGQVCAARVLSLFACGARSR